MVNSITSNIDERVIRSGVELDPENLRRANEVGEERADPLGCGTERVPVLPENALVILYADLFFRVDCERAALERGPNVAGDFDLARVRARDVVNETCVKVSENIPGPKKSKLTGGKIRRDRPWPRR